MVSTHSHKIDSFYDSVWHSDLASLLRNGTNLVKVEDFVKGLLSFSCMKNEGASIAQVKLKNYRYP